MTLTFIKPISLGLISLLLFLTLGCNNPEVWPQVDKKPEYKDYVTEGLKSYKESNINHRLRLCDYDYDKDYLNYGKTKSFRESDSMRFDEWGIPMVKYGEEFYYNPVTVSQYALALYGKYLDNPDLSQQFLDSVDRLILLQDDIGAFRYEFNWRYYLNGEIFQPGWVSGMAQGQALSVLARAYLLSGEEKYLKAGRKALDFLVTPVSEGGTMYSMRDLHPSLDNYIIFEEYIAEPASYTLNGFMFTLLGLYDWSMVANAKGEDKVRAKYYFDEGIKTLKKILPYYDIGGMSTYDLGYITYGAKPHVSATYHAVHIQLLHALYAVTSEEVLHQYEQLWTAYVE